jgi:hypothetical protein
VSDASSAGTAAAISVTTQGVTNAPQIYEEIGFIVSCRRDALFQIIHNNNGSETILAEMVVGSGAYTALGQLHCLSFQTGATGTQELKIKAMNFEAQSSLRASLTATELA